MPAALHVGSRRMGSPPHPTQHEPVAPATGVPLPTTSASYGSQKRGCCYIHIHMYSLSQEPPGAPRTHQELIVAWTTRTMPEEMRTTVLVSFCVLVFYHVLFVFLRVYRSSP